MAVSAAPPQPEECLLDNSRSRTRLGLPHERTYATEAGVGQYEKDGGGAKSYHSDPDGSGLSIS